MTGELIYCNDLLDESEYRSQHSWGDIVDETDEVSRTPGKAVHMHEKLSSPSRKR